MSKPEKEKRIYLHRKGAGVLLRSVAPEGHKVYFLENAETGRIKIGTTAEEIGKRISSLQTGNDCELRLLGWIAGGEWREKKLHARFKAHHVRGEWFSPDVRVEVLELIAACPSRDDDRRAAVARIRQEHREARRAVEAREAGERFRRVSAAAQAAAAFARAGMGPEADEFLRRARSM